MFEKANAKAAQAPKDSSELDRYEDSLKVYRDLKNVIDTARDEGKIEGKIEMARALKDAGISVELISKSSGLSEEEIREL